MPFILGRNTTDSLSGTESGKQLSPQSNQSKKVKKISDNLEWCYLVLCVFKRQISNSSTLFPPFCEATQIPSSSLAVNKNTNAYAGTSRHFIGRQNFLGCHNFSETAEEWPLNIHIIPHLPPASLPPPLPIALVNSSHSPKNQSLQRYDMRGIWKKNLLFPLGPIWITPYGHNFYRQAITSAGHFSTFSLSSTTPLPCIKVQRYL